MMSNPDLETFYRDCDYAHFFAGLSVTLIAAFLYLKAVAVVAPLVILYAGVKEFWYDENFETPDERGSNLRDFLGYALGVLVGLAIVAAKLFLS